MAERDPQEMLSQDSQQVEPTQAEAMVRRTKIWVV